MALDGDLIVLFHSFLSAFCTLVALFGLWDIFLATYEEFLISIFCLVIIIEVIIGGFILVFNRRECQLRDSITFYLGPLLICSAVINLTSSLVITFFIFKMSSDSEALLQIIKIGYGSPWYTKITGAWDRLQENNGCCGIYGPKDYRETDWYIHQHTFPPLRTPESCSASVIGCYPSLRSQTLWMGSLFSLVTSFSTIIKVRIFKSILYENNPRFRLQADSFSA
ncbi:unnamed protein product [Bursaphelenchus xylophilus]|uniref:(pine wood nematode) hypothetical protein n=1 Tax=Bursaphelenchus xylophilus TaxID=6326 RepID=A0A1I7RKR5_BURXY|nr:unnamed protein product [Bursaphelenchus xylophilus]CAG9131132.1 unnamed protein product [Bursaphelenchus xylophilus]